MGHVVGANVIAGCGEREVFSVEGLTKGGGRGIIVRVAELFHVLLPEELHVVGRCDARVGVGLLCYRCQCSGGVGLNRC